MTGQWPGVTVVEKFKELLAEVGQFGGGKTNVWLFDYPSTSSHSRRLA
jgi:hypothetical protein